MRLDGDLDGLRPALGAKHAYLFVNEAYEMLHLIQDGLNL
jgi:hypothetical protein